MAKDGLVHLIIGKDEDIGPKTKTGCGKLFEDVGNGATYKFRAMVTCPDCLKKVEKIEKMKGQ
jgi:hypothetical protein